MTNQPSTPKPATGFVEAYAVSTGAKQIVPAHWIGHPVLGRNLTLTPSERERQASNPFPPVPAVPAPTAPTAPPGDDSTDRNTPKEK